MSFSHMNEIYIDSVFTIYGLRTFQYISSTVLALYNIQYNHVRDIYSIFTSGKGASCMCVYITFPYGPKFYL